MCICIKTSSPCLPIPGILQSPRPLALRCGPRPAGRVVVAAGFAALGRRAAGLGPGAAGVVAVAAGRGTSGAADADGWDEVGHLGLQKIWEKWWFWRDMVGYMMDLLWFIDVESTRWFLGWCRNDGCAPILMAISIGKMVLQNMESQMGEATDASNACCHSWGHPPPQVLPLLCAGRRSFRFVSTGCPNSIKDPCFMEKSCSKPVSKPYFFKMLTSNMSEISTKSAAKMLTSQVHPLQLWMLCTWTSSYWLELLPDWNHPCLVGELDAGGEMCSWMGESTLYLQVILTQNRGFFPSVGVFRCWETAIFVKCTTIPVGCTMPFGLFSKHLKQYVTSKRLLETIAPLKSSTSYTDGAQLWKSKNKNKQHGLLATSQINS